MVVTSEGRPDGGRPRNGRSLAGRVLFDENSGVYTGEAEGGRVWRITAVVTGWRLEFRDAGDGNATYAGVHRTVEAAIAEANR